MSKVPQSTTVPSPLPRVLFLGTQGIFSRTVLGTLLNAQIPLCGVLLPAPAHLEPPVRLRPAPSLQRNNELLLSASPSTQTMVQVAWQHNLPVFEVGRLTDPTVCELVQTLAPDVACVACFSKKIPRTLLALLKYGFLNVHPSQLPAYRGPAPLFWQLRDGIHPLHVTVHWMDTGWDTGDLASQAAFNLPDGAGGATIDQHAAEVGGALLVNVLQAIAMGHPPRTPQPPGGSYQSWPSATAFTLETNWSAQHAFNFMRGTSEWGYAYQVEVNNKTFWLTHALTYAANETLPESHRIYGTEVALQFNPGVLRALLGS